MTAFAEVARAISSCLLFAMPGATNAARRSVAKSDIAGNQNKCPSNAIRCG